VGGIPTVVYIKKMSEAPNEMSEAPNESAPNAPAPVRVVAPAGGRKAGRGNYTREEMINFLNIMARILPIGGEEFDEVLQAHSLDFPGRDVDSLRRKYGVLHRKPIPTGDPSMPPEVLLAKRVKYAIGDKATIGDGQEEYNLEEGTFATRTTTTTEDVVADEVVAPPAILLAQLTPTQTQTQTQQEGATATPPPPRTPTLTSLTTGTGTGSNRKRPHDDFLELYRLQMQQESESRKLQMQQEAESRKQEAESRKALVESLGVIAAGIASAFAGKKKKRKRTPVGDSSSDSDTSK
jgi:hypothetical protein